MIDLFGKKYKKMAYPESSLHKVFRQEVGQTGYSKHHIIKGKVSTPFTLIIDHRIMSHIKT